MDTMTAVALLEPKRLQRGRAAEADTPRGRGGHSHHHRRPSAGPTCTSSRVSTPCDRVSCSDTSRSASSTRSARESGPEYHVGQRVVVGAITPCGQCFYCLNGSHSQCGGPLGGWRFGNTIDGAWAEFLLVPDAKANLAPIPDGLSDEDVLLVPDIFSTGLSGAESAGIKVGDAVAVFAQGPIGLCATLGAKLRGAALIVAVDHVPARAARWPGFGADVVINHLEQDPVAAIKRLTGGRGADAAIEALGRQETFEAALRAIRPGGTLSSSRRLRQQASWRPTRLPFSRRPRQSAIAVTTLCPAGKEHSCAG